MDTNKFSTNSSSKTYPLWKFPKLTESIIQSIAFFVIIYYYNVYLFFNYYICYMFFVLFYKIDKN